MAKPDREIPTKKYKDWRKYTSIKRFNVKDDRVALYYVTGGGTLMVLTEREFGYLAGLFQEELGNIERERK